MKKLNPDFKPAAFVERQIVEKILSNQWKKDDSIPPERQLVQQLGVTRQTIRETLKKLAAEGWLTIKHGKPTKVNDFLADGSLATLKTIAKYSELIPLKLVNDWLEFRIFILPDITQKAVRNNPDFFIDMFSQIPDLDSNIDHFIHFDWNLQKFSVQFSNNAIAKMIFNDLESAYLLHSRQYFQEKNLRQKSIEYYKKLKETIINNPENVAKLVRNTMKNSYNSFIQLNQI